MPVHVLMTPAPVFALTLGRETVVIPITALTPFFHEPVPVSAILALIPHVVIAVDAIVIAVAIVAVMVVCMSDHGQQERSAEK
jgi:hypothetical protein